MLSILNELVLGSVIYPKENAGNTAQYISNIENNLANNVLTYAVDLVTLESLELPTEIMSVRQNGCRITHALNIALQENAELWRELA
jgi:hypothetical protein